MNKTITRHINSRHYFTHDLVWNNLLKWVVHAENHKVADALMKSLQAPTFTKHRVAYPR